MGRRQPRGGQLVCQHLERIKRAALEKPAVQRVLVNFVRRRHGVYALYRRDRLVYVGLASNLHSRLKQHLKDRHADGWDSFNVYITLRDDHIRELESLVLRIAAPKENRAGGRFVRSEDLQKRFRKSVAAEQKRELDGYFLARAGDLGDDSKRDRERTRRPVLAAFVDKVSGGRGFPIRVVYKGSTYKARVLANGEISYAKARYASPSVALKPIFGRAVNGWTWWQYKRSPGEWVKLDTLRQK